MKGLFKTGGIAALLLSMVVATGLFSTGNVGNVQAGSSKSFSTKGLLTRFAVARTLSISEENQEVLKNMRADAESFLMAQADEFREQVNEYVSLRSSLSQQAREQEERVIQIWNRELEMLQMVIKNVFATAKREHLLLKRRLCMARFNTILQEINSKISDVDRQIVAIIEANDASLSQDEDLFDLALSTPLVGYNPEEVLDVTDILTSHVKDIAALERMARQNKDNEMIKAAEEQRAKANQDLDEEAIVGIEKEHRNFSKAKDEFLQTLVGDIRDNFTFNI